MTANVNRWKETFAKLTLPIGWLWFTLLPFKPTIWAQSYPRKRTKCTTPLQERHFPTPLRHAEKQPLCWNWANEQSYLCRVL